MASAGNECPLGPRGHACVSIAQRIAQQWNSLNAIAGHTDILMRLAITRTAQVLRHTPGHSRLMVTAADVEGILKSQLAAQDVQVIDTSGGCGASFDVAVVSDQFEGKKLLERHRMVSTVHSPAGALST